MLHYFILSFFRMNVLQPRIEVDFCMQHFQNSVGCCFQ